MQAWPLRASGWPRTGPACVASFGPAFAAWSLAFERCEVLKRQLERVHTLAEVERQRARVGEESGLSARRFTLAEAEVRTALGRGGRRSARTEALARAWRADLGADAIPGPAHSRRAARGHRSGRLARGACTRVLEAEQAAIEKKRAGRFLAFPTLQFGWQQLSDQGVVRSGPIFAAGWTVPALRP